MTDKPGLGDQVISKAVEVGLASQMDEVENLEVDIRTDPFKLMQGKVDSVAIAGEGLVVQQDLRTEEMQIQVDSVGINPLKAAFGEIELTQPTNATAHVVLTEKDVERAFNSDYVKNKLQNLEVHINGQPFTINTQHVGFRLPGEQKIALDAEVAVVETGETKHVAFSAVPEVKPGGATIVLSNVQYSEGEQESPELTEALLASATELLDLRNFDLNGIDLSLKQLNAQAGKISLEAEAYIEQFPGTSGG